MTKSSPGGDWDEARSVVQLPAANAVVDAVAQASDVAVQMAERPGGLAGRFERRRAKTAGLRPDSAPLVCEGGDDLTFVFGVTGALDKAHSQAA